MYIDVIAAMLNDGDSTACIQSLSWQIIVVL
eukprot:COSAG06_NODE_63004_length_263_cov_0.939024_1_plen_30_part_01